MGSVLNWKVALVAFSFFAVRAVTQAQQDSSWEDDFKTGPPPGQQIFTSNCAGCHGLDGHGSEKAPNIASSASVSRLSNSELARIIRSGVEGSGMPAFHSLSSAQIQSLVSYLRTLQGKSTSEVVPGNAKNGREIFYGKGECSNCHMVSGTGGFLGPDLTDYGSSKSPSDILKSIVSSDRSTQSGYRSVAITTQQGDRISGVLRNEDNFSLQVQTEDGTFRFFEKSELQKIEYVPHSAMPSDYATRLNRNELNDLVNFLVGSGNSSNSSPHTNQRPAE